MLECDADTLIVGVPGLALPDSALATALLPSVPDMVEASLHCSRLARKVARPTQPPFKGPPDNAAGALPLVLFAARKRACQQDSMCSMSSCT